MKSHIPYIMVMENLKLKIINKELLGALKGVVFDHTLRMKQYPDTNNQPHKIAVMNRAEQAIAKAERK